LHTHDTADITGIEAEEDTTEGGKGAHEVGFGRHGRFNAARVGRSHQTSSHGDGKATVELWKIELGYVLVVGGSCVFDNNNGGSNSGLLECVDWVRRRQEKKEKEKNRKKKERGKEGYY